MRSPRVRLPGEDRDRSRVTLRPSHIMKFILKMAWRDSRASRSRLALFSLSVVLGIAALVSIGSFSENLRDAIDEQAKGLLCADIIINTRTTPSEALLRHVRGVSTDFSQETRFSSMMTFPAAQNLTRLVQVRATDGKFPFYGEFTTDPIDAPAKLRAGGNVVILEDSLLRQFETPIGGTVRLGSHVFAVIGALKKLPGDGAAIAATFAPRAIVPATSIAGTGLDQKNVLLSYRLMLKLPPLPVPEVVVRGIRQEFHEQVNFETLAERKRNMGRALENIEGFL